MFVCRGSAADGLGHVIRTRTVVEATTPTIAPEVVVIGDELPAGLLGDLELPWSIVPDETTLVERVAGRNYDAVVFDLIALSRGSFEELARGRVAVALSPIFDHLGAVDLSFSRTRYGVDGEQPAAPGAHHGLDYAIVRPECRRIHTGTYADHLDDDGVSIAISMGGADAPNRTLQVIDSLRPLSAAATFWVILGEGYAHSYRELVDRVRRDTRHEIILAKTNRSMWRILRNCSLAILAGGVTTYEAAYAGLPSINVLASENDAFLTRELVERGAAVDGGTFGDGALPRVLAEVERLVADPERLLGMHRASRNLIDGRGAERVSAAIAAAIGARGLAPGAA